MRYSRASEKFSAELLPVNQPSGGQNSPYAAATAFALDPVYLALDQCEDFVAAGGFARLGKDDQAAIEAGDPIAFAAGLARTPFSAPRDALFYAPFSDESVPNQAEEALAHAAGAAAASISSSICRAGSPTDSRPGCSTWRSFRQSNCFVAGDIVSFPTPVSAAAVRS